MSHKLMGLFIIKKKIKIMGLFSILKNSKKK
jgi:hypothetical protein